MHVFNFYYIILLFYKLRKNSSISKELKLVCKVILGTENLKVSDLIDPYLDYSETFGNHNANCYLGLHQ